MDIKNYIWIAVLCLIAIPLMSQSAYALGDTQYCRPNNCSASTCYYWNDATNITGSNGWTAESGNSPIASNHSFKFKDATGIGYFNLTKFLNKVKFTGNVTLEYDYRDTNTGTEGDLIFGNCLNSADYVTCGATWFRDDSVINTFNYRHAGNFNSNYGAKTTNTWYHIRVTVAPNADNYKVWLNGVEGTGGAQTIVNTGVSLLSFFYYGNSVGNLFLTNITVYNSTSGLSCSSPTISKPVISAITNRTKTSIAVINWTTDLASNTSVNYGLTQSLGTWSRTNDAVTAHSKSIVGLTPSTKYYFNVTSCNAGGCSESGYNVMVTKAVTINLTIPSASPPTNTQYNTNPIIIRANISSNLTAINCSLNLDGSVIDSKILTTNREYNYSYIVPAPGNYTWFVYCTNTTTYQANMTASRYFYFDDVLPVIKTNFMNRSIYYKYKSNITSYFNFSDANLFSINVSIDGVQIYGATNIESMFRKVNLTHSVINYSSSIIHNLTAKVADGHTSYRLIDTYRNYKGAERMAVLATQNGEVPDIPLFSRDNIIGEWINKIIPIENIFPSVKSNLQHITISVVGGDKKDSFNINEKTDRYTFDYTPINPRSTYQFEITSDTKLYVVNKPNTIYSTWIVTGDKWVDFLLEGEPYEKIDIKKTSDYSAIVTISNLKNNKKLNFNSIGELNIVTNKYSFYTYANNPAGYANPHAEISYSYMNLTINKSNELTTSTILTYNGVKYTNADVANYSTKDVWNKTIVTPSLINAHTYNASWNYTVSNSNASSNRIVLFNQKVTEINLTNCSTPHNNISGINFSVVDIDTGAAISNTSMNGVFTIWTDTGLSPQSANIVKNFNIVATTGTPGNVFRLCVNSEPDIFLAWDLSYQSTDTNYVPGQSIVQSLVIDTDKQNITNKTSKTYNLPLMKLASSVVINVIDRFGTNLVGYYVKMFLVKTGLPSTLTTSFITDFKGEWAVSYNPINSYSFDVYNPAKTIKLFTTNTTKITSNPFVIQIPNSQNDLKSLQAMTTYKSNVSCNAVTNTCKFTWNDAIVKTAFFEVFRVNGWGSTKIYNDSTDGTSGTMSYHVIENMTGNSYHAVGSIITNTNNSFYVVGVADLLAGSSVFGFLGDVSTVIFVGFFIVLTLSLLFIDIGPIGLTIGMLLGLLAGTIVGVIPLTIAGVIALACVLLVGLYYGRG
jgi:uncharacterized protein YjbI with pentapeptide repeats